MKSVQKFRIQSPHKSEKKIERKDFYPKNLMKFSFESVKKLHQEFLLVDTNVCFFEFLDRIVNPTGGK